MKPKNYYPCRLPDILAKGDVNRTNLSFESKLDPARIKQIVTGRALPTIHEAYAIRLALHRLGVGYPLFKYIWPDHRISNK